MAEKLKIIPLGGLDEIGKNITVLEYGKDMIVVDCGVGFPDEDMYGVDLVIPDFTYLVQNEKKLRGMFITHGHEDHIGAIPYVLQELKGALVLYELNRFKNTENIIEIFELNEKRRTIKNAVDKLPNLQREAIILKYYHDLKIKEISNITGHNENTVKSRLFNGIKNLKKIIGGEEDEWEKRFIK